MKPMFLSMVIGLITFPILAQDDHATPLTAISTPRGNDLPLAITPHRSPDKMQRLPLIDPSQVIPVDYAQLTSTVAASTIATFNDDDTLKNKKWDLKEKQKRLTFSVDYLNWQIRRRDLDFGIVTDQTALALGSGTLHEVEFGQSSGFRSSVAYAMQDEWQILFSFSHYTAESTASVAAPPGQSYIFATRSHPKFNEEALTASAQANFSMNIFDVELRHSLVAGERAIFDLFGGIRWAENDQLFSIDYDGRDFNAGEVDNSVDISMFGLRMGGEGIWSLPNGFHVFGNAEGSLMYGDYNVFLEETDLNATSGAADILVSINDSYEQALPAFSAALGIGWDSEAVEIRLGYEFSAWFNLSDRTVFLDDTHEAVFSKTNHDVMMDGFFLSTTFNY
jgi:hypothetical protein